MLCLSLAVDLHPKTRMYDVRVLPKSVLRKTKHCTWRVVKLRFITLAAPAVPEQLTLLALSPEQRSYRVFIDSA